MAELGDNPELEFIRRTLEIYKSYSGNYEVTLAVNCLLGLVVLPKENNLLKKISEETHEIEGIEVLPDSQYCVECSYDPKTLRGLVYHLRHAVAHFKVETEGEERIEKVIFTNNPPNIQNLNVKISIEEKTLPKLIEEIANNLIETR